MGTAPVLTPDTLAGGSERLHLDSKLPQPLGAQPLRSRQVQMCTCLVLHPAGGGPHPPVPRRRNIPSSKMTLTLSSSLPPLSPPPPWGRVLVQNHPESSPTAAREWYTGAFPRDCKKQQNHPGPFQSHKQPVPRTGRPGADWHPSHRLRCARFVGTCRIHHGEVGSAQRQRRCLSWSGPSLQCLQGPLPSLTSCLGVHCVPYCPQPPLRVFTMSNIDPNFVPRVQGVLHNPPSHL